MLVGHSPVSCAGSAVGKHMILTVAPAATEASPHRTAGLVAVLTTDSEAPLQSFSFLDLL